MGRGIGLAVLGGVVGAVLWGVIAYLTGWSIGIIALIVGTLVGVGMQWGIRGRGTVGTGITAAAIALFSIVAAKFVVAQAVAGDWVEQASQVTEADAIDHYASEVYDAFEATGQYMSEPDDGLWPPEVMVEAERLWEETPEHERREYMAALSRDAVRDAEEGRFGAGVLLFVFSFGPINLIILALAVATAYRTGRHTTEVEEQVLLNPPTSENGGVTGGPLARSAPSAGGAPGTTTARPRPKPAKELDEDDRRGAGIFARLAQIEEHENKKADERKNAA